MNQKTFTEIDTKFAEFQEFLKKPSQEQAVLHATLCAQLGKNHVIILKKALMELGTIRNNYKTRFCLATDTHYNEAIIKEYNALYFNLHKLTQGTTDIKDALEKINKKTKRLKNEVILKNVLNVTLALALVLPIAGAIILIPLSLALIAFEPFIGISLTSTLFATIILSVAKISDCMQNLKRTTPIIKRGELECSFFSKIGAAYQPAMQQEQDEIQPESEMISAPV